MRAMGGDDWEKKEGWRENDGDVCVREWKWKEAWVQKGERELPGRT